MLHVLLLQDCTHSSYVNSKYCLSHKTFVLATKRHVHPEWDHTSIVTGASTQASLSTLRRPKVQVVNSPNIMYLPCLCFSGLRKVLRKRTVKKTIIKCRCMNVERKLGERTYKDLLLKKMEVGRTSSATLLHSRECLFSRGLSSSQGAEC